jgi:hypothetical protein
MWRCTPTQLCKLQIACPDTSKHIDWRTCSTASIHMHASLHLKMHDVSHAMQWACITAAIARGRAQHKSQRAGRPGIRAIANCCPSMLRQAAAASHALPQHMRPAGPAHTAGSTPGAAPALHRMLHFHPLPSLVRTPLAPAAPPAHPFCLSVILSPRLSAMPCVLLRMRM